MKTLSRTRGGATLVAALLWLPVVSAQTLGGGGGPAGDASQVEKCDAPKGTLAVVEPQYAVLQSLSRYGLQTPGPMIRLIIQQSNCFQIVERGAALVKPEGPWNPGLLGAQELEIGIAFYIGD